LIVADDGGVGIVKPFRMGGKDPEPTTAAGVGGAVVAVLSPLTRGTSSSR
jgi:hypothetical protein